MSQGIRKFRLWPGLLLAGWLALGAVAPVASAQQSKPGAGNAPAATPADAVVHSWALSPGDGTQNAGQRSNLSYELAPGTETHDVATLYNYGNVPLTFFVYPTDAFNNEDGSFDLLAFDQKPTDVGTWFDLPEKATITVPAGKQATFPFTIHVPVDARPGDHAGALLASSQVLGTGEDGGTITVDRRTGSRVYVRVAGPLDPQLAVEQLHTSYTPSLNPFGGTAEVSYRVVNRGNVRLTGTHRVSIGGPLGLLKTTSPSRELSELLPGEGVTFTAKLEGVSATALAFTEVKLEPTPVGEDDDALDPVHKRSLVFALPFTILALAAMGGLAWYARRSYRRHDDASPGRRPPLLLGRGPRAVLEAAPAPGPTERR